MVGFQTEQDRKKNQQNKITSFGISIQYCKKDHVEERNW